MKAILSVVITIVGCNLYLIWMLGYLVMRPRRKRDRDGNIIWDSERD